MGTDLGGGGRVDVEDNDAAALAIFSILQATPQENPRKHRKVGDQMLKIGINGDTNGDIFPRENGHLGGERGGEVGRHRACAEK